MLTSAGDSLVPSGSQLGHPNEDGGGSVLVDQPAFGYWVDGSGYPALNGIFSAEQRQVCPDGTFNLLYRHTESRAELRWVPQGWLLRLSDGTDCFLQMSTNQLMVLGTPHSWQAIDSEDTDPLAEPPDEVVALLDEAVLDDLIRAKRAHDEHIRRARAAFALPYLSYCGGGSGTGGASPNGDPRWWRVVHSPAVIVRAAPSTGAAKVGLKICGELVLGLEVRGAWVKVHAPDAAHTEGWMLADGASLGLGVLLQRCGTLLTCVEDDGEADWEELARGVDGSGTGIGTGGWRQGEANEACPGVDDAPDLADASPASQRCAVDVAEADEVTKAEVADETAEWGEATEAPQQAASVGARLRAKLSASCGDAAEQLTPARAANAAVARTTTSLPPLTEAMSAAVSPMPAPPMPASPMPPAPLAVSPHDAGAAARLKSLGDTAFRSGSLSVAVTRYSEAIAAIGLSSSAIPVPRAESALPAEAILLCNRSAARRLLRELPGAIADARQALDLAPTYKKAALRHGVALLEHEEYLRARSAFEHLLRLDGGYMALPWLQRCHARLQVAAATGGGSRSGQSPSHYTLLDVPCDCSEATLRSAYKRRSLQCHPDRRGKGASSVDEADATETFQRLQAAYEVLKEPKARAAYDFGTENADWEAEARARYFPPAAFRPFAKPARTTRPSSDWDPVC